MPKLTIKRFNGGMINDSRIESENSARVITNFNIHDYASKLLPNRASESGDSGAATAQIQNFVVALGASSTYRLFGLGVVSGTGRAKIYYKNLTTGSSTDLDDNGWTETSNNSSASGSTSFDLLVYYKTAGLIYGAKAGTSIWSYDPTGSASFTEAARSISYTNIAQGIVHSKDDIMYIPYDNKIASYNQGTTTWTDTAITLPSKYYITSICEHNNSIAIACAPLTGIGNSRLFLWDRNTSLTTLSESIDLGPGVVKIIEQVDGVLISISRIGGQSSTFVDRVVFKYLSGNEMLWFNEIKTEATTSQLPIAKQNINGKLYFLFSGTINGAVREGLFSISRRGGSQFSICHESTPNNSTALTNGVLKGFFVLDDYVFMSYVDNGTYGMSKTDDQATYTTSIYESLINPGMSSSDRENPKKMIGVRVTHEPLTSGQTVVLKYRVDSASSGAWTTVLTSSTVGAVSFSTNVPSAGSEFTDGVNYEFRLESTAGAVITSFSYKYENISDLI